MKGLVVLVLLLIMASLGKALVSMTQGGGTEQALKTAQALTARITLSVGLFALLFAAYHFGWITPHGKL